MVEYHFELAAGNKWFPVFEALSAVLSETNITISTNGLEVKAMDSVRVVMTRLQLNPTDFETFPEIPDPVSFGINLTDVVKVLKRFGKEASPNLIVDDTTRSIAFKTESAGGNKGRKLSVKMITIDPEEIPFEQLMGIPLANSITMDSLNIVEALLDAEIYSDAIDVDVLENELVFKTEGTAGELEYQLDLTELGAATIEHECKNTFTIAKFKTILKLSNTYPTITLGLDSEAPLRIIYKIWRNSQAVFFLAPRVETSSDEAQVDQLEE